MHRNLCRNFPAARVASIDFSIAAPIAAHFSIISIRHPSNSPVYALHFARPSARFISYGNHIYGPLQPTHDAYVLTWGAEYNTHRTIQHLVFIYLEKEENRNGIVSALLAIFKCDKISRLFPSNSFQFIFILIAFAHRAHCSLSFSDLFWIYGMIYSRSLNPINYWSMEHLYAKP